MFIDFVCVIKSEHFLWYLGEFIYFYFFKFYSSLNMKFSSHFKIHFGNLNRKCCVRAVTSYLRAHTEESYDTV